MGLENKTIANGENVTRSQKAPRSSASLIKPGETLVKREDSSVVVRNTEGKLVRRKDLDGDMADIYNLIKLNEVLVSIDGDAVVVRNEAGKLVKRRLAASAKKEVEPNVSNVSKVQEKAAPIKEDKEEHEEPKAQVDKEGLRERLLSKHAFLDRLAKGESVSAPKQVVVEPSSVTMTTATSDIEEIEDIEDVETDKSVQALESAVTQEKFDRTMGNGSSKGVIGSGARNISHGAINPNEKPLQGVNGKLNQSLAGNVQPEIIIAQPEVVKKQKVKKQRKPLKQWMVIAALVSIYIISMLAYFFTNYNFEPKKVDVNLYYISIGEDAKLNYYDGEKINTTDMLMTFYYSKTDIKQANLVESNLAESTVGMGYSVNSKGYITALWQDGYESADSRQVKLKFTYDGLISYVPVTIYRNKLTEIIKKFEVPYLSSGLELIPTIYGVYTNEVLLAANNKIQRELSLSEYDLILTYNGNNYNLKELNAFDGIKYTLPEMVGGEVVDYTASGIKLTAVYTSDGYNTEKQLQLYSK